MPIGTLYIVSTPIGNLNDISMRSLSILDSIDLIAAEDTRNAKKLLKSYNINSPLISLHNYNERGKAKKIVSCLLRGISVAIISDAGTPMINDPGYYTVSLARSNMIKIVPVPGACALVSALCVSSISSNQFFFHGFLPPKARARRKYLKNIIHNQYTSIFYESTHRVAESLSDICNILGNDRVVCVAKEITKSFEVIRTGAVSKVFSWINSSPDRKKGEFVIIIDGSKDRVYNTLKKQAAKMFLTLISSVPLRKAIRIMNNLLINMNSLGS